MRSSYCAGFRTPCQLCFAQCSRTVYNVVHEREYDLISHALVGVVTLQPWLAVIGRVPWGRACWWRLMIAHVPQAMNGQLEFFNVDEFEIMNAGEHFMCTDIEWDPTGRYVATSVTSVHQMENGFNVWSWNGHLLYGRASVAAASFTHTFHFCKEGTSGTK